MAQWHRNCRSFPGTYACDIMTAESYRDCGPCKFYDPIDKKILILKLGAMGDVIRTTTILPAIKKKYSEKTKITWVVSEESKDLLHNNDFVDQILVYNPETTLRLAQEQYDVLFSLEVAPPATLLANTIKAREKYGFYFDKDGNPSCFNKHATQYLDTVFSNKVNQETQKTYQEMIFRAAELPYDKQEYILELTEEEKTYGKKIVEDSRAIGINVGAGGRWQSKSWHPSKVIKLAERIANEKRCKIVLLGGKKEEKVKAEIAAALANHNIKVIQNDSENTIRQYMSVINACDTIVTNDSVTLHIAIGLKKKVIALFFVTAPWQIEPYGRVHVISSPMLKQHYMDDRYYEDLVNSISVEEVSKNL